MLKRNLSRFILASHCFFSANIFAQTISFDAYHNQDEINQFLFSVAELHSDIAQVKLLGYSQQNRPIYFLVIGNDHASERPSIYFNATHHGDEKSSTESSLALIDYLIQHRHQSDITTLFNQFNLVIQPLVNPDGHAQNRRFDIQGRDPNRDYSYPGKSDEQSFKIPEIQLVKLLFDSMNVYAATAYHSGMEAVLWPWCHTREPSEEHNQFLNISKLFADAMRVHNYGQSYFDYPSHGEFIDYAYWKQKTLALTVEVSAAHTPQASQLNYYVSRAVKGSLAFLKHVHSANKLEKLLSNRI